MKKLRDPKMLLIVIIGLSLCLPLSVNALSQDRPERSHPFMLERIIDFLNFMADLDLTEDQKTTLKDLVTETRDTITPLIDEIKELRNEKDKAIFADNIDAEKASELNKKMIEVRSQISTIVLNAKLEGMQVLTPEQRAMILEKKEEHRKRIEELKERFRELRDVFTKLFLV